MALVGDTGNGATVTFATTSLSLLITSIQIGEETVEMLDVSTLATTGFMESIASDLKTTPEVTLTYVTDTSDAAPAVGGAAETITITAPQRTGETAAATYAGTAQITSSVVVQQFANGQIQTGQLKFKYNGDTGPTFTAATTS